jgi:DNA repair exonuclease SbcCD ATPase subunit
MNNPNLQLQKSIYQTQCTYLYWYVFLNILAINKIFWCRDGEPIKLRIFTGNELIDKEKEEKNTQKENQWSNGVDIQPLKKDGLEAITPQDIRDLKSPRKPVNNTTPFETSQFPITTLSQESQEEGDIKEYKSPAPKLSNFFKRSRDKWKSKCIDCQDQLKLSKKNLKNLRARNKELKEEIKTIQAEVTELKSTKEYLKQQLEELEKSIDKIVANSQTLNVVPARHQYPIGIIYMYVSLVLAR